MYIYILYKNYFTAQIYCTQLFMFKVSQGQKKELQTHKKKEVAKL
jgi:hypothetical protein